MKKIVSIAALLITLCNVGAGIAYACECYENGQIACKTTGAGDCYRDAGGRCHCNDVIIIIVGEGDGGGAVAE